MSGIEDFNKQGLKKADTQVKNVLPDQDSKYIVIEIVKKEMLHIGFTLK